MTEAFFNSGEIMKKSVLTLVMFVVVSGCATMPSPEEIAALDYEARSQLITIVP